VLEALVAVAAIAAIAAVILSAAALRSAGVAAERLDRRMREELSRAREESAGQNRHQREELSARLDAVCSTIDARLKDLQQENAAKLEQMRQTVDEKLQTTLQRSFRDVQQLLDRVQVGLGEMQALASGVGDLKKALLNVRTRGVFGEIQLGALLEQVLSPEQYAANVATTGTAERVEYAIKLPGRDEGRSHVWLPIDAKFPLEDYHRLMDAADPAAMEAAGRQLEVRLKACARDISLKYLKPPQTTDFAILFLPVEGLYAEALRRGGLAETLQRDFRVSLAGPTTLGALLNSLQMGFRTLAIQQRSSEVWNLLGAVKTEFGKYADVLVKVQKKLLEATNTVEDAAVRTRAIERKLRGVESGPEANATAMLDSDDPDQPRLFERPAE
jgi:DNA recombination protein RmuC